MSDILSVCPHEKVTACESFLICLKSFPHLFAKKFSSLASTPKVIKSFLRHFTGNYLVGFEKKENKKVFMKGIILKDEGLT